MHEIINVEFPVLGTVISDMLKDLIPKFTLPQDILNLKLSEKAEWYIKQLERNGDILI